MSEFEKVQTIVRDLTRRVQAFNRADWVMVYASHLDADWRASSTLSHMASAGCPDPFTALSQLEEEIRRRESADLNFAKTIGLEVAE